MDRLPTFARTRLMLRQDQSEDHPDTDRLLAFTEQKLSPRDRSIVLKHLAHCSECREVVALTSAIGQGQKSELEKTREVPGSWWRWRGAAAAAVACLLAIVVWRPDWNEKHEAASPFKQVLRAEAKRAEAGRTEQYARTVAKLVAPSPPLRRGAKRVEAPVSSNPLPRPAPTESASIQTILPPAATTAPFFPSDLTEGRSELLSSSLDQAVQKPSDRTLAITPHDQSFASGPAIQPRFQRLGTSLVSRPIPNIDSIWRLGAPVEAASGGTSTLERSDDGGRTWHTVSVDHEVQLYALSANRSNIWVGGTGGALFHSTDAGRRWTRVAITDGVTRLTDAITRIDSYGEWAVDLKSRSGSDWVTKDGGVHWRLK